MLIATLQQYQQTEETPSNTSTIVDLATSEEAGDQSEPEPLIDVLLGDSDAAL
jgi:hypothetical protein